MFRIIGEIRPNQVKLKSISGGNVTCLSKSKVRSMFDTGQISIVNPELLFHKVL